MTDNDCENYNETDFMVSDSSSHHSNQNSEDGNEHESETESENDPILIHATTNHYIMEEEDPPVKAPKFVSGSLSILTTENEPTPTPPQQQRLQSFRMSSMRSMSSGSTPIATNCTEDIRGGNNDRSSTVSHDAYNVKVRRNNRPSLRQSSSKKPDTGWLDSFIMSLDES